MSHCIENNVFTHICIRNMVSMLLLLYDLGKLSQQLQLYYIYIYLYLHV